MRMTIRTVWEIKDCLPVELKSVELAMQKLAQVIEKKRKEVAANPL